MSDPEDNYVALCPICQSGIRAQHTCVWTNVCVDLEDGSVGSYAEGKGPDADTEIYCEQGHTLQQMQERAEKEPPSRGAMK